MLFDNEMRVMIFGGTGTLGSALVDYFINNTKYDICVISRDEQKHYGMRLKYNDCGNRIVYALGDVADREFVVCQVAMYCPSLVINTSAQKHVHISDENITRLLKTNVLGLDNILLSCLVHNVKHVLSISSDKAVEPTTVYGMSKSLGERLLLQYLPSYRARGLRISCARYGNVLGSKGSLFPLYQSLAKIGGPFPVTNPDMTRFTLTIGDAVDFLCKILNINFVPGIIIRGNIDIDSVEHSCVYVPLLNSFRVGDLAELFVKYYGGEIIHKDPHFSEKIHEKMASNYCSSNYVMTKDALEQYLLRIHILESKDD